MKLPILVLEGGSSHVASIYESVLALGYGAQRFGTWGDLLKSLQYSKTPVLLLDLDTAGLGWTELRQLRKLNTPVYLLTFSQNPFHPEIKENSWTDIFASLAKPVDPDELGFWLRSIEQNSKSFNRPAPGRSRWQEEVP